MSIRSAILGVVKDILVLGGIGLFLVGAYFYMGSTPDQYAGFSPITIGLSGGFILFIATPIIEGILRRLLLLPKDKD